MLAFPRDPVADRLVHIATMIELVDLCSLLLKGPKNVLNCLKRYDQQDAKQKESHVGSAARKFTRVLSNFVPVDDMDVMSARIMVPKECWRYPADDFAAYVSYQWTSHPSRLKDVTPEMEVALANPSKPAIFPPYRFVMQTIKCLI